MPPQWRNGLHGGLARPVKSALADLHERVRARRTRRVGAQRNLVIKRASLRRALATVSGSDFWFSSTIEREIPVLSELCPSFSSRLRYPRPFGRFPAGFFEIRESDTVCRLRRFGQTAINRFIARARNVAPKRVGFALLTVSLFHSRRESRDGGHVSDGMLLRSADSTRGNVKRERNKFRKRDVNVARESRKLKSRQSRCLHSWHLCPRTYA